MALNLCGFLVLSHPPAHAPYLWEAVKPFESGCRGRDFLKVLLINTLAQHMPGTHTNYKHQLKTQYGEQLHSLALLPADLER